MDFQEKPSTSKKKDETGEESQNFEKNIADKNDTFHTDLDQEYDRLLKRLREIEILKKQQENLNPPKRRILSESGAPSPKKARIEPKYPTFEKVEDAANLGKVYEYVMCALYALKLCTSDDVIDFQMTSNNQQDGLFDDIGIKVTFKNRQTHTYLFQLKHKKKENWVTLDQFEFGQNGKGDFSLYKYINSLMSLRTNDRDVSCIICTNCPSDISQGQRVYYDWYGYYYVTVKNSTNEIDEILLNNKSSVIDDNIFQFCNPNFSKRFFLFSQQNNLDETKLELENLLKKIFQCNIYVPFISFMEDWWFKKYVLTKNDILAKLSELALSPYTRLITGDKSNSKTNHLARCMMDFEMTIVRNSTTIIENIWPDVQQQFDISKTVDKYSLSSEEANIQKSKVLWYWGVVPLIVNVNDGNRTIIKIVLNLLHRHLDNKKFVLVGDVSRSDFQNWKIFENFGDVSKHYSFPDFKISIQGRGCLSLEDFVEVDPKFSEIIGTNQLLEMSQRPFLLLGKITKTHYDSYISRQVSASFIKVDKIFDVFKNCTIIINCDTFLEEILRSKYRSVMRVHEYVKQNYKQKNVILTSDNCTIEQFQKVCAISDDVSLLQMIDDNNCVIQLRIGSTQMPNLGEIEEDYLLSSFTYPLNIICGPPGMGKSILFHTLSSRYCPSDFWSTHINLVNHNDFFRTCNKHEDMLNYFLEEEESILLCQNKKVFFFLDGLDEVDSSSLHLVLEFIKYLLSIGGRVWLSSRENLRSMIIKTFKVAPLELKKLNKEQQQTYISKRLKDTYFDNEINDITNAILSSTDVTNSQELLGVPLQLYMITEIFVNNRTPFENLNKETFVLTKIYKLFFDGKKNFLFDKLGVSHHLNQMGFNFDVVLKPYEILALKSALDSEDFQKLGVDIAENASFLTQIKNDGDKLGIITDIEADVIVFHHQTYAEYFACRWFRAHKDKVYLLRENLFSERYQNLKLIFDIMFAEKNPLHLAIIYRNVEQFDENLGGVNQRDEGGRSAMHLACSYGQKYPLDHHDNNRFTTIDLDRESNFYIKIINILLEENDIFEEDVLLRFSCFHYSLMSQCLYPLEKMLQTTKLTFHRIKSRLLEQFSCDTLAYYSAQLGYYCLLSSLIEETQMSSLDFLLDVAVIGGRNDISVTAPRQGNLEAAKVLMKHGATINDDTQDVKNLLDWVCSRGCYDMLDLLLSQGIKRRNDNTILHITSKNYTLNDEVIRLSKAFFVDGDSRNRFGETPLHLACLNGDVDSVKKLIEMGVDTNALGKNNNNAFHYVDNNTDIIDILINEGVDINRPNNFGETPLHVASKNQKGKILSKLIDVGANIHLRDNDGNSILHSAVETHDENEKIIELVLRQGIDADIRNNNLQTPLQIACKHRTRKNITLLLQAGAKIDVVDSHNRSLFDYTHDIVVIDLLIDHGLSVNSRNENGQTPLFIACKSSSLHNVEKYLNLKAELTNVDNASENVLDYAHKAFLTSTTLKLIHVLLNHGLDVETKNKNGQTPLEIACECGSSEDVKRILELNPKIDGNIVDLVIHSTDVWEKIFLLIEHGLDVNFKNQKGESLLQIACGGRTSNVEKLIELGADINTLNTNHHIWDCYSNNEDSWEMTYFLLERGLDINFQNSWGETPLQVACMRGEPENVRKLLKADANIYVEHYLADNLLELALAEEEENVEVIELLLDAGLDVDIRNVEGETPLQIASSRGQKENVRKFLKAGADVSTKDRDGNNVLHSAVVRSCNTEIIELLKGGNVDIEGRNNGGQTPLLIACQRGDFENVRTLLQLGAKVNVVDGENKNLFDYVDSSFGEEERPKVVNLIKEYSLIDD